jgi:hypothetical protein
MIAKLGKLSKIIVTLMLILVKLSRILALQEIFFDNGRLEAK